MKSTFVHYTDKKGIKVTVCIQHYAGKVVKGVAKCSPNDAYNQTVGDMLAQKRCCKKVAERRLAMSERKVLQASIALTNARKHLDKMLAYESDAKLKLDAETKQLKETEDQLQ